MAFANPLVIAYGAGNKSLPKINTDNYGSEYYLREATQEFRAKVRHSTESTRKDGVTIERHNVELTRTVFSTTPGVPDVVQQAYLVFRNHRNDSVADAAEIGASLTALINEAAFNDLGNWLN